MRRDYGHGRGRWQSANQRAGGFPQKTVSGFYDRDYGCYWNLFCCSALDSDSRNRRAYFSYCGSLPDDGLNESNGKYVPANDPGIVADSGPEAEWKKTLTKARALLASIKSVVRRA